MASSGMLRRVALVVTDVSEELSAYIIGVTRSSSETSGLTKATRRNISEDAILHSHGRENLKSYMVGIRPTNVAEELAACIFKMEEVPKRLYLCTERQGPISQKTMIVIYIVLRTCDIRGFCFIPTRGTINTEFCTITTVYFEADGLPTERISVRSRLKM
jgi:hypothetical protein